MKAGSAAAHAPNTYISTEPTPGLSQILFVDSDQGFLAGIKKDKKSTRVPPLLIELGGDAINLLTDPNVDIKAIYVGQGVHSPDAVSVLRRARQLRPTTPIFLMYEGESCQIEDALLKKLGNCVAISKKFTYGEIAQKYFPASMLFDPTDSKGDGAELGQESFEEDSGFTPIRAETFVSGSKSVFDVYVRLGSGRFLKILKSGDDFSKDRVSMYLKKGVEHFHIRKNSHADYLAYSHKLAENIIQHPSIPIEVKARQAIAQGSSVVGLLREKEIITEAQLQFGETYVGLVHTLVSQVDLEGQSKLVATLLRNPTHQDHFVCTVVLGGLVSRQLGFETKKSASLIGMGCLLHDVGLFNNPELELVEECDMSEAQKTAFYEHPIRGARILNEIRGLNPAVPQIVLNHHRRKNGTGFPNQSGLGLTKITVPIEIVGVVDEIVRLCTLHPGLSLQELHGKIRLLILPSFSGEVAEAVVNALRIGGG